MRAKKKEKKNGRTNDEPQQSRDVTRALVDKNGLTRGNERNLEAFLEAQMKR